MLILARKVGQKILIGDDIEISIVDIRGDQVRIGINAPQSVSVCRAELQEQVASANLESASAYGLKAREIHDLLSDAKNRPKKS